MNGEECGCKKLQDVGRLGGGGGGGRGEGEGLKMEGATEDGRGAHTHTKWLFPITIRAAINDKKYAVFIGRA